ncbi:MAG TPA: flagellar assembly protein FliX [Alphaproteobacteria bacterium]|nr:flagellar assembly protein FliX [Rhodospirillaceae bacterium]HRJ12600.1 flagellar assembly protein FliX [Alphaproteobacteria bacterium]
MDVSRISRTDSTKAAGKSGGAKRAGGPDFKSLVNVEEAEEAEAAHAIGGVRGMGSLLLAQESGDALEGRRKNQQRAKRILDDLEELQMALLTGTISETKLRSIAHVVAQERAHVDDPALNALLDDIELRAAIEMAKLGFA